MIEYIIGRNSASLRADRFLLKATTAPSSLIYKAFRKKDVKINGKWIKEDYVLSEGDILRIYIKEDFQKEKGRRSLLSEKYVMDIIREGWKNDDERLQRVVLG